MNTEGNQPAFPVLEQSAHLQNEITLGLTKREYFAGLFAVQMCAGYAARMVADRDERYDETNWKEIVAANAIEFADELLKQLNP